MMTILLPIPAKKKNFETYYLPYNIGEGYINKSIEFQMKESESIKSLREHFETEYGIDKGSYVITMVHHQQF